MEQHKNNLPVIIGGIIVLFALGYGAYAYTSKQPHDVMEKDADAMMKDSGDAMMKDASTTAGMMDDRASTSAMMMKKDQAGLMMQKGAYLPYSADKLALADHGKVVLFFRASWCPTCRALDADIRAHLGSIPDGVTILDVDYDKYTDLKQKYGVTTQHTLVEVDVSGNLVRKWTGSPTLASVVAGIK